MEDHSKAARMAGRQFEAVKFSLTHKRDGYHLSLVVQPNDMDQDIFTDLIGQRYMVVMVPVDDDETPKLSPERVKKDRLFVSSHTLCKLPEFWDYLMELQRGLTIVSEEDAGYWLKDYLGIESRNELKTNEDARERFEGMIGEFEHWRTTKDT